MATEPTGAQTEETKTTDPEAPVASPTPNVVDPSPVQTPDSISAEQMAGAKAHHFLSFLVDHGREILDEIEKFIPKSVIDAVANTTEEAGEEVVDSALKGGF